MMGPITDLDLKMAIHDISPLTRAKVYDDRTIDYLDGEPSFSFQDLLVQIIRKHRNHLLAQTDWMANSDVTMTEEWRVYRQALRDITTQTPSLDENGNLTGINWPTPPEA